MNETPKTLSPDKGVQFANGMVRRPANASSQSRKRFLDHLESKNLPVGHMYGVWDDCEWYAYIEGQFVHPQKWRDEALFATGRLVRALHDAARDFAPETGDAYAPWCLREIGSRERLWCHGDIAPWNTVTKDGLPFALIDWEFAGPLDPMVELARVCWLFPQLCDDEIGRMYDLPAPKKRAEQVRLLCDGYGLSGEERKTLTERILEVVICETAHEAIDPNITPDDTGSLWGFAWRTRSLYWIWRNRRLLQETLAHIV